MKKEVLIMTLCSCAFATGVLAADLDSAIIFEADYTKSRTEFNAQKAEGNPTGRLLHSDKYQIDFEPMEAINNGAMIGRNCASIRYSAEKNLNPGTGSIELVVKSLDWEWNDDQVHIFMQSLNGGKNSFYFYKHSGDGVGAYFSNGEKRIFPRRMPRNWKKDEKHHLLVTYDRQMVRLYFDGMLTREVTTPTEISFGKYFEIGGSSKSWGRSGQSVISHVVCYNRPLTAEEVAKLAKTRLPDLKLGPLPKTTARRNLSSSPFFQSRSQEAMEALSPDFVPFPWNPIKVELPYISIWNRTYDLSGTGVFQSVTSAGRELLKRPVIFETDSKELALSPPKLKTTAKGRVEITREVQEGTHKIGELLYRFEYDGAVFLSMQLDAEISLNSLLLKLPLKENIARMIHYTGTVSESLRSAVSPDISYSRTLPENKGIVWCGGLHTTIWLGDNRGGLQFFTGSDQGFFPKDRKDYFTVSRNDQEEVTLSVNYLTSPFPKTNISENKYDFGIIATPVRPMPRRWREFRLSAQYNNLKGIERGNLLIYWPDEWVELELDPDPVRGRNKAYISTKIKTDRKNNRKIVPYYDKKLFPRSNTQVVNPDLEEILEQWGMSPQRQSGGSSRDAFRVATTSQWSDYLVWCLKNFDVLYGKVDGFYMDEMELAPNVNMKSGGGYTAYDGKIRPTYSLAADRELYKRMNYIAAHGDATAETFNIAHCSGTHMMPLMSHFPFFLVAEHLFSGYFTIQTNFLPPPEDKLYYYSYALPMDRVRAEFYHGQWGSAIAWLPCLKNQRDIMEKVEPTRDMLSRIMHADVLFWPLWCNQQEIYKIWKIREDFRIGDDDVEFIPYWENTEMTTVNSECAISYYKAGDGRYLVIVSNLARKNRNIQLQFAPELKITQIQCAETDQPIIMKDSKITVTIPRNDYRVLLLNYKNR